MGHEEVGLVLWVVMTNILMLSMSVWLLESIPNIMPVLVRIDEPHHSEGIAKRLIRSHKDHTRGLGFIVAAMVGITFFVTVISHCSERLLNLFLATHFSFLYIY